MAEEKSAVDKFLGELGSEGDKDPLDKTPEDPFTKNEVVEEEPVEDEKPLPFHRDPKVQKFIDKQVEKRLEQFERSSPREERQPVADDDTTDVLTRLIGNDTPEKLSMIKEFKNILERGTQRAKEEAIAELESRQERESENDREAEVELEDHFDNIEDSFDVDITSGEPEAKKRGDGFTFTRKEFVSFVEKIAPKDRYGEIVDYPDMTSAWETFSEIKRSTTPPSRAKELASRSMARSSSADVKPDISHLNFDNIMEHLSGK